jgi:hypothetical protein
MPATNVDFYRKKELDVRKPFNHISKVFLNLISIFPVYGRIWTRLPFPDCDLIEEAFQILEKCGIPRSALVKHDQSDCDCEKARIY